MNAPLDLKLTKPEFLRWVQRQQGHYELKGGQVMMHAGTTRRHWLVYNRFIVEIAKRLDDSSWVVGGTDLAVEIGDTIRYPDVLVEAAGGDGDALTTKTPAMLIEVLSPSSVGTDMTEKPSEYGSLPSLAAYIVASQDEPIVWAWIRTCEDGANPTGPMPTKPLEISGRDAAIEIPALGLSIPLQEIYRGIGTP
ncbi:MAG: Uma2 family endonuclease [Alphaproteobacteria bacterium]|nr:Uma2 family endonuclease [Alphaproteobacteria bacterium]